MARSQAAVSSSPGTVPGSATEAVAPGTEPERGRRKARQEIAGSGIRTRPALEWFHRIAGLLLFLVSLPLYPVIGLMIKIDDGGSIFYRGARLGLNGKRFIINKFRTLRECSEEKIGGRLLPMDNCFETRVGKFLRETRLDEIPQFWNVVRGEMHLVGPRPVRPAQYSRICQNISGYDRLFSVKPGMTGFAQFYTPYHTDKRLRLRLDLVYLTRKGILLDARILVSTLFAALRRVVRRLRSLATYPMKPEWKFGGVAANRRQLPRLQVPGDVMLSFTLGDNGKGRVMKRKARFLNLNEEAVAVLLRRPIPDEVGKIELMFRVPIRRGRERKVKTARADGWIMRRRELQPPAGGTERGEYVFVIRFSPTTRLDSYKIDKYFLRKSVADA